MNNGKATKKQVKELKNKLKNIIEYEEILIKEDDFHIIDGKVVFTNKDIIDRISLGFEDNKIIRISLEQLCIFIQR